MTLLVVGLIIFFGIHSVSIVNNPLRDRLAASLGVVRWKALYALVALGGFLLMVAG